MLLKTAPAVLFVGLLSLPVAHADGNDDLYLKMLAADGITGAGNNPGKAIAAGHVVCAELKAGKTGDQIANELSSDMPPDTARLVVIASVMVYCPPPVPPPGGPGGQGYTPNPPPAGSGLFPETGW